MVNKTEEPGPSTAETAPATDGEEAVPDPQMRAVVLNSYGGLKGIQVVENKPQPQAVGESEILLKTAMSSLNFQDLMTRLGVIDSPPKIPFVMGSEVVGTVIQIGKDVSRFKVGDIVYGLPETGAWAEFVILEESLAWLVTKTKLDVKYVATSLPYIVAHYLLQGVAVGSSVVIHSAGGSVGLAVRDLAKMQGCKVLGICSGYKMEKISGFESLIDRTFDYVAEIKKLYPAGVNLVLDPQGGEDCTRGLTLLSPGGKYILYGSANIVTGETKSFFSMAKSWWQVEKVSPLKLFEENKFIGGLHLRNLLKTKYDEVGKVLDKLWGLMESGQVKPTVDSIWSFEEVPEAMQKMHDRKNIGKLLIDPAARKVEKNDTEKGNGESNAN
ncbi:unnamed protein product [Allacma fusca]|uniref:Enoyl reductase (ER) domain-containing protein n=1 Tax=Allacma fusca TaxID=39272 RepID=A0A8J2PBM7_9HEXA|nr:unnamed protein product [Allacma fusca]